MPRLDVPFLFRKRFDYGLSSVSQTAKRILQVPFRRSGAFLFLRGYIFMQSINERNAGIATELNRLSIHVLRALAREVGVKAPTKMLKEEIIENIIAIKNNEKEPVPVNNQGRPANKNTEIFLRNLPQSIKDFCEIKPNVNREKTSANGFSDERDEEIFEQKLLRIKSSIKKQINEAVDDVFNAYLSSETKYY